MGQTPQTTVDTIFEVSKSRRATEGSQNAAQHPRSSVSCGGHVHRCWMDHPTILNVTWRLLVIIANTELTHRKESNRSLVSWHSSRLKRVTRPFSAAETQEAADDDEAVYSRLCVKEILLEQLDEQTSTQKHDKVRLLLVADCRGLSGAVALRLVFKDKKSGLDALAVKQSLEECGTMIRWCHSAAQQGDVVTKDSDVARAPWELFVRRGFRWKLIHEPTSNPQETVQNVNLTCWENLTTTNSPLMFHEIRKVTR